MRHFPRLIATLSATLLAVAAVSAQETLRGEAGVVDGDTIAVASVKIRLEGIDAPEAGQTCLDGSGKPWACGAEATEMMIRLANKRMVGCTIVGLDRYGRSLGTCYADGSAMSLNAQMVEAGMARAFVRYSSAYVAAEATAQAAGVGIWAGTHQAPWDYRAERRTVRAGR